MKGRIILGVLVVLIGVVIWHYRIEVGYALVAGFMLRIAAHRAGYRPRRSSFAAKVTAVSAAYGAWNTRWLKPRKGDHHVPVKVTARANVDGPTVDDDGIPY
jgi:hypothetical protein